MAFGDCCADYVDVCTALVPAAAPAPAPEGGACMNFQKAFTECINNSQGSISECQFLADQLKQCKAGMV